MLNRANIVLWHNLIALYEAWNKPEKEEKWRAKLTQVEDYEK